MLRRVLLLVLFLFLLSPGPFKVAAAPTPIIRENLEYQISLGPWSDVGLFALPPAAAVVPQPHP